MSRVYVGTQVCVCTCVCVYIPRVLSPFRALLAGQSHIGLDALLEAMQPFSGLMKVESVRTHPLTSLVTYHLLCCVIYSLISPISLLCVCVCVFHKADLLSLDSHSNSSHHHTHTNVQKSHAHTVIICHLEKYYSLPVCVLVWG